MNFATILIALTVSAQAPATDTESTCDKDGFVNGFLYAPDNVRYTNLLTSPDEVDCKLIDHEAFSEWRNSFNTALMEYNCEGEYDEALADLDHLIECSKPADESVNPPPDKADPSDGRPSDSEDEPIPSQKSPNSEKPGPKQPTPDTPDPVPENGNSSIGWWGAGGSMVLGVGFAALAAAVGAGAVGTGIWTASLRNVSPETHTLQQAEADIAMSNYTMGTTLGLVAVSAASTAASAFCFILGVGTGGVTALSE